MRHTKSLYAILMLILSTIACQAGGAPATPTMIATVPAPSASPSASAPPASATPTPQPVAATRTPDPNEYYNSDYGVHVHYPTGWTNKPGSSKDGYLVMFMSPSDNVYSSLWVESISDQDTPEALAKATKDAFLKTLTDVEIEQDAQSKVGNGLDAWTTIFAGTNKDRHMKTNITVTTYNGQAFFLISVADLHTYDQYTDDVNGMIESLIIERPSLYGNIPREQALIYEGGETTNLAEYDPATTHGSGNKFVFDGLVAFDPKLNLVPDLAESWDVSADGMTFTFHIRKNARFHSGRPVTAQDFVYSWERAADPKTQSDTVLTYLGDIVGIKEMHNGKTDHISGLKVVDEHTLQVTIDAPKPYFLLKLTYPTGFVVDKENVETGKEWVRKPNGTGPYKLTRWDSFKVIIYERNTDYYLGAPSIPYVIIRLYTGNALRLYETGDIDISGVSSVSVPRVTDPKEPLSKDLVKGVSLCTNYIVLDTSKPPFDDVKVRQAFALSLDRQQYIETVTHGISLPAEGLYPPGLPGYDPNFKGLGFDPTRAQQLLKESKYGNADKLPPIVFTESGFGTDVYSGTAALAQMWQKTLGVQINVENVEPNRYSTLLHSGVHGQIFTGGWCADYPDPENFADALFHTGAPENNGHYSNPALDAILEQARTERDVTKRISLYQQAQQIIVQDAPVIFTTHGLSYVLVKPYVKGYVYTPIDVPLERYMSLDWSGQNK